MFNWINIELTNRCNKSCSFCNSAKARLNKELDMGDMPLQLVNDILVQFEGNIVQLHRDGEPLLYEQLQDVGYMCRTFISNIVTNGKLLWDRRDVLIDNFTSITVSVFEDDEEQFENVKLFIENRRYNPFVIVKFLGDYYNAEYEKLDVQIIKRQLFGVNGYSDYKNYKPTVPEIGICLDFLNKPSIDWQGKVHICNRIDPEGKGIIGDCTEENLRTIWEGELRTKMKSYHAKDMRDKVSLCSTCEYWGCPSG